MKSTSRTRTIAIAIALVPAGFWILWFLWDPGATLLPVLALIWSLPALLGWRHPAAAGSLLIGVAVLGLLTAGLAYAFGAGWLTFIPVVLYCVLPLVSALFFFAAIRATRKAPNLRLDEESSLHGSPTLPRGAADVNSRVAGKAGGAPSSRATCGSRSASSRRPAGGQRIIVSKAEAKKLHDQGNVE